MISENTAIIAEGQDFEALLSRYSPVLYRMALRRLRNPADAEDAVQDALLSAYKHREQFAGRSKISTWLTTIVINCAGMQLRKRSRQHENASLDENLGEGNAHFAELFADEHPNPEQALGLVELRETIHRALGCLSPRLRAAIQLHEIDGFSIGQAARILGIGTNAMKARLRRGRAALGAVLGTVLGDSRKFQPIGLTAGDGQLRSRVTIEKRP